MSKQKAFTLIELLVVIAIMVLLMAILMPALQRVKKQAQAVACQSNLKQWGVVFSMYTDDNDGYFETPPAGHSYGLWMEVTEPYYKESKLLFCPMATKTWDEGAPRGDPFAGWGPWSGGPSGRAFWGSYGPNLWITNPPAGLTQVQGYPTENNWRTPHVNGANTIPMFLDQIWYGGWPEPTNEPPLYSGEISEWHINSMKRFCINRHSSFVNGVFVDFSTRKVGLKELWTLKWHREYDTTGPWTQAGLVQSSDWPDWMRRFKDY
jgi:prepilin-type N-terminal cleavage/methylation domain-containing protein